MARIVILTLGSRGDVQPYAALAQALAGRGHEVTLSAGQGFSGLIPSGVAYAPLSIDMEALLRDPEIQAAMLGIRAKLRAFRASRALMLQQLDEMRSIAVHRRPDAILYHPKAFVAPYLARALGASAIPSFLQPAFQPTRAFPNPLLGLQEVGPRSNWLQGHLMIRLMRLGHRALLRGWLPQNAGVPPAPRLDPLAGYHPNGATPPRLYAHSPHLVPKPDDWQTQDHVTGDWHGPAQASWTPPEQLEAFLKAGPAPIYVGFGSMPALNGVTLTRKVLAALEKTGQRAILSAGWGGLDAHDTTEAIHVLREAPHDWLFPRCRAVVHHGGAGTTHAGLRHGRPTLVCPYFGDQPFWGQRVAAIRAGPQPLPVRSLSVASLTHALKSLEDPGFAQAAGAAAQVMARETGAASAADLIEDALRL